MSENQLKDFIARLKQDAELRSKLSAKNADAAAIAKAAGFHITTSTHYHFGASTGQHTDQQVDKMSCELADNEVESVIGGGGKNCRCLSRHYI